MTVRTHRKRSEGSTEQAMDPLYAVFEEHLFNWRDSNTGRVEFVEKTVQEYLKLVRGSGATIPLAMATAVVEELKYLVESMLTRKTYGHLTIESFRENLSRPDQIRARKRYNRVKKATKGSAASG